MLDIRKEAALAVVKDLAPFESAVDVALARTATLMASLAENNLHAQLEPRAVQPAIMTMVRTITALGQAREGMVDMRRDLVLAQTKIGLREVSFGGLAGCPDAPAGSIEEAPRAEAAI